MDSKELWSIEAAKSMEESFIDTWSDALKLPVTLQLCTLAETQQINWADLDGVKSDLVSLVHHVKVAFTNHITSENPCEWSWCHCRESIHPISLQTRWGDYGTMGPAGPQDYRRRFVSSTSGDYYIVADTAQQT
jgi:hypothetical protein